MRYCEYPNCGREHSAKGWCKMHYGQMYHHGETWDGGYRVRSREERFWEKVDKRGDDECWNWTASLAMNGYGALGTDGRSERAHRVSYEIHNGPIPEGAVIDHQCRNKACVNPKHLLLGTQSENTQNVVSRSDNTTGYRGVSKKGERYRARVTVQGKVHYVGVFDTAEEAGRAAREARMRLQTNNLPDYEN